MAMIKLCVGNAERYLMKMNLSLAVQSVLSVMQMFILVVIVFIMNPEVITIVTKQLILW